VLLAVAIAAPFSAAIWRSANRWTTSRARGRLVQRIGFATWLIGGALFVLAAGGCFDCAAVDVAFWSRSSAGSSAGRDSPSPSADAVEFRRAAAVHVDN
jgi:hypothetical protein